MVFAHLWVNEKLKIVATSINEDHSCVNCISFSSKTDGRRVCFPVHVTASKKAMQLTQILLHMHNHWTDSMMSRHCKSATDSNGFSYSLASVNSTFLMSLDGRKQNVRITMIIKKKVPHLEFCRRRDLSTEQTVVSSRLSALTNLQCSHFVRKEMKRLFLV